MFDRSFVRLSVSLFVCVVCLIVFVCVCLCLLFDHPVPSFDRLVVCLFV